MTRRPLLRLLFWAALLFGFVMAILPMPPALPGDPGDKVQHILAFLLLAALAVAAYPRAPLWGIALRLSAFGALIEAVQAIPALRRDADVADWIADTAAVSAVLGALWLFRRFRGWKLRNF